MTDRCESAREVDDGPQWGKRNHRGYFEIGPQPALNPLLRLMGLEQYKGPSPLPDSTFHTYRRRTMQRARAKNLRTLLACG